MQKVNQLKLYLILLLAVGACWCGSGGVQSVRAQGMTNINVTGIPPIIQAPFTDQIAQNFRNGRYQVIFTYNSSNPNPVDFRFEVTLTKSGRELVSVMSNPKSFRPGAYVFTALFDELPFPQTFKEVVDRVDNELKKQVLQEGTIPEGSYMLNIKAIPDEDAGMIATVPSVTPFTVRFPQPPRLINPMDNANLTLETPVFNWTPIVGVQGSPIAYDFLLVEVLPNQTPLQALNGNRALAQKTLFNQNTLVYTPEFLPLEKGRRYVWQITARLPDLPLPLKNDGESELQTFIYKGDGLGAGTDIGQLQSIPLVPGFASLTGLDRLSVNPDGNTYVLNGKATMKLSFGQDYDVSVMVQNLKIQQRGLDHPVVVDGQVTANHFRSMPFTKAASDIAVIKKIRWKFDQGVQATGDLRLPNGQTLAVQDWVQLTAIGLNGTFVADDPNGLITAGDDPVRISLTHIEASFPQYQLYAEGKLDLFDNKMTCEITQLNLLENQSEAIFNCPDDASISLVNDSAKLNLLLDNLTGSLNYNFQSDDIAYDLTAMGNVNVGVSQAGACSAYMQVNLTNTNGFTISQISPSCSVYTPPLDLGFMKFKLDDINLQSLNYIAGGDWDFDLQLDGFLTMPAMDGWTLPLSSVDLTSSGLQFPNLDWNTGALGLSEPLTIDGFGIKPTHFHLPEFTFPWFDWPDQDGSGIGDWNFDIDFDFNFPDFASSDNDDESSTPSIIPECVVGRTITGVSGNFNDGNFSANLPATVLQDCQIELADEYTFIIDELSGELTAEAGIADLNLESQISLDAHFLAGSPFNCGNHGPASVGNTELTMDNKGLLDGSVDDIVTNCQANLGPFDAEITRSDLNFTTNGGTQKILIDADGSLALNKNQQISGTLKYDVLNGRFDELNFVYNNPFVLNLPSNKKPLLSFLVDGLSLTRDGLMIDGRQEFLIGDPRRISSMMQKLTGQQIQVPPDVTTIGVTFDKTLIDLETLEIQSGRIIFDKRFALKAGLNEQSNSISFLVAADTSEVQLEPNSGYLKLGTNIIMDKDGLRTKGNADAGIQIADLKMDSLKIQFRNRFAMGLQPFGVKQGRADLLKNSRRVAYINSTGFHLDPVYLTQAIPDTLPLPTKESAYLVLRHNDNLLVQANKQSDGTYQMSTSDPVDLVIPAIQGNRPLPPKVGVSFTNITYDPASGEITAGVIQGDFDPAIDLNDIGVPFKVRSIRFGDGVAVNNQQLGGDRGLYLQGDILLYQTQIGDAGSAALFLENGDHLRADVDLQNLDSDIALVPQSNLSVLHVDSLGGSINVALDELAPPDVRLDMRGQFRLQNQDDSPIAALNYSATYDDGNFGINAKQQPQASPAPNTVFIGPTGFRIDKINTLTLSYSTDSNDFDFRSELDFSVLMKIGDTDTLEVPLHDAAITENGFTIPDQTINENSRPVLNAPPFSLGPVRLTLLEFRTLHDITFNWFTGAGFPPAFQMDFDMKMEALSNNAPQASQASLTLQNVGYNQGVFTGTLNDFTSQGPAMPILLGGETYFNLAEISGGLINTGTVQNPVQGYDIKLAGNLDYPDFFSEPQQGCSNPTINVNLSRQGGLTGVVHNIAPCGTMKYGPATLSFNPTDSLAFAFNNDVQQVIVGGSVNAEIAQENSPDITASGEIKANIITGDLIDGFIAVNDLFTFKYPQDDPLFTFRVQHALLNTDGLVFTGNAGLTYPNSQDTAKVTFTNFTIHPQNDTVADGHLTFHDSFALEVGVSPMDWKVVDPSSEFTQNNTGRLLTAGSITLDTNGLSLSGSSIASIRVGGQLLPNLTLDYSGFQLGFSPIGVNSGEANFIRSGEQSRFAYIDKDQFHIDPLGLATSVLPDTLDLPNRDTAFLVLGDNDGSRYELDETQSPHRIHTLQGQTVSLVIPGVKKANNDTLKIDVAFDMRVDDFFNISSGSVSLQSPVDLSPYLSVPLQLDSLSYSNSQGLKAAAEVKLPSTLNNVDLMASIAIDNNGFEQASISAGQYSQTYLPSQENVAPIAADTLGNGALAFYVRGLEIEIGQTNSIAFSGQLKSNLLEDDQGIKTPIHYAAGYNGNQWNVTIDDGNLSSGIDLGYAKLTPETGNNGLGMFNVTMDDQEFAVSFSALIKMPELLGDDFSLDVEQLRISTKPNTDGDYVAVNAAANLASQNFKLINGILDLTTDSTIVSIQNKVISVETSGTFNFYDKSNITFEDLKFSSDGAVRIGDINSGNLLQHKIEMLPDSSLVLSELNLGVDNNTLQMNAAGFAALPNPLKTRAQIAISADTDGNIDVSGPDFQFDDGFSIGNPLNPNEFAIGSFATLEITGIGLDIHLKDPTQTALYAAGAIYINNDVNKRIMFGDAGDMQSNPGIKYSIQDGVEWNASSSFDPTDSPFSFEYEFFNISVASIQIQSGENIDGPFQATIGGLAGLNIEGVGGEVDFSGFKFSLDGVDDIGQLDGGSFTLMNIVSLELGSFEYKTAEDYGGPFTLEFAKDNGSSAGSGASVDTVEVTGVTKYLYFGAGPNGQAINLSLGEGISGGVDEVIYYQKGAGENVERYLKIKNAHLELNDQARVSVGMEFLTDNGNFALSVAGAGKFGEYGIAAAGSISTINNDLRFGIFVAASVPITFAGIVTVNKFGGGFYYRPTADNLTQTIDAIKGLDDSFELNGDPPDVHNLKFAALVYGNVSIVGSGGVSAINGSCLIQVTDQFTKLDANGSVLNQGDRFEAGMYLTILYSPEITGIEGGVNLEIKYGAVLAGDSEVDFFATKDKTNDNADVLWGITGNFHIEVLPSLDMLHVDGSLIVSPDGLLLDLEAGKGFDVAIISANASFKLTVWYLPDSATSLGIYGKFSLSFSICHGLADFGASVEGGYFHQSDNDLIYFAGEAHISVIAVIDADIRGWVKFQTKSPNFDYGRGGSAEMEQMIADAREKAGETKEKAEDTKSELNEAKDDLNDALAEASLTSYTNAELEKAGYNVVSGNYFSTSADDYSVSNVLNAERSLHGPAQVPDIIDWIADNVMKGDDYAGSYNTSLTRERPEIEDDPVPTSTSDFNNVMSVMDNRATAIQDVQDQAPQVENRLQQGIQVLDSLSNVMQAQLDQGGSLTFSNPVSGVQDAVMEGSGDLVSPPSFQVNTNADEDNKDELTTFENDLAAANQRYRQAIQAAAANIKLVDMIVEGDASINWGPEANAQLQPAQDISVNDLAFTYTHAVRLVRAYNSELIGSYWNLADWAHKRYNIILQNAASIRTFARKTNDWSLTNTNDVENAADVVEGRTNVIESALGRYSSTQATSDANVILNNVDTGRLYNNQERYSKFRNTGVEFWYDMPRYGLDELKTSATAVADSLSQAFDQTMSEIESSHRAFTESVDQLYAIKTEMLTTVYGMIEEYNGWREEAYGQVTSNTRFPMVKSKTSSLKPNVSNSVKSNPRLGSNLRVIRPKAPFTDKKQQIQQALAPPVIDHISANGVGSNSFSSMAEYDKFYGEADLSYQASHPQGIPEISYSFVDGTVQSIYAINQYYSAGVWNNENSTSGERNISMAFPKQSISQVNKNMTAAIRARGVGGTTVSRLVNFRIAVGPGGTSQEGSVTLGSDNSPPSIPVITHDYSGDGNAYWTPDSTTLRFTFKSADSESDIRLFKYSIGTTMGGNDIRDWTDAQGTRGTSMVQTGQQFGSSPFGYISFPTFAYSSKLETVIRGLNLQAGTDYYLSVKAMNGDNMESSVKNVSMPFRYEPSPPAQPIVQVTYAITQRQQPPSQPVIQSAVPVVPEWDTQKINNEWGLGDNQGQEVTLSWSSQDPESGIEGFFWDKKNSGNLTSQQAFGDDDYAFDEADAITEWNTSPSFKMGQYWYFQARNYAGMTSSLKVVGPIKNGDVTVPTTPDVKVRAAADGFYIYITKLADDAQTNIKGYQYSITGESGSDTLRAWPDSSTVDFVLESNAGSQPEPPVKFVPWGTFMQAGSYNVSVRAVNEQNMASRVVTNTNVQYDDTPPMPTIFNAEYEGSSDDVVIYFNQAGDPESGLKSIKYELVTHLDSQALVNYDQTHNDSFNFSVITGSDRDGYILDSGSIPLVSAKDSKSGVHLSYPNLHAFAPLFLRITVQNNLGSERMNEDKVKISERAINKWKQQKINEKRKTESEREKEKNKTE